MGRNILLGFAGPGKVSHTNAKDLLDDYVGFDGVDDKGLPDFAEDVDTIRVVLPVSKDYLTDTVELLWEWADDYADLPYEAIFERETGENEGILKRADQVFTVRNVAAALVDRLVEGQKNGDEVALIVAWGDDGDDATEMLVDLAKAKEIKVLDITAGLDDLSFGEDPEPEPEPEPEKPRRRRTAKEPEPEQATEEPRPRRGKPRKAAETSPEPAEAAEPESVEQEVAHARQEAQKGTEHDVILSALIASQWLARSLDACHAAMSGRAEPVPSELSRQLERAIDLYTGQQKADEPEEPVEETPVKTAGRRRKDGSPAQPRTPAQRGVKEFLNDEGEWVRAGRGRLPAKTKVRFVDPKTGNVISED